MNEAKFSVVGIRAVDEAPKIAEKSGIRKYRLHLALFLQLFYWDAFSANS